MCSTAIRSSNVDLHSAERNDQSSIASARSDSFGNASLTKWEGCPEECSECCKTDVMFGLGESSSKFKCVLKHAATWPENRRCSESSFAWRQSNPSQAKIDCEFTRADAPEAPKEIGKCSKKSDCCCPKSALARIRKMGVFRNKGYAPRNYVCDASNKKVVKVDRGDGVVEILERVAKWTESEAEEFCFTAPTVDHEIEDLYERKVFIHSGQCFTDLNGLVLRGSTYECPSDMINSNDYSNIFCKCDTDC